EGLPQSVGKTNDKPPFYAYSRHLSNSAPGAPAGHQPWRRAGSGGQAGERAVEVVRLDLAEYFTVHAAICVENQGKRQAAGRIAEAAQSVDRPRPHDQQRVGNR